MKANGDHMTAIKAILTEYPELIGQIEFHADAIKETAEIRASHVPAGQRDSRRAGPCRRSGSDAGGLQGGSREGRGLAEKLADAAKGGDVKATLAAFAALGKEGCGGCHETFRKKDS